VRRYARRLFGETGHGNQTFVHGIGGEPKAFEGESAQNWFRAGRSEHHKRRLLPSLQSDLDPGDWIAHQASIGQFEWPLLLSGNAQLFEHVARNPAVRRSCIDQCPERRETVSVPPSDLNRYVEVAHIRI